MENFEAYVKAMSPSERAEAYQCLRLTLERDIEQQLGVTVAEIRKKSGAQSMSFMIDMLPHIWKHLLRNKWGSTVTWLDVGPAAGYGASLLAFLHSGKSLGCRLKVSTLDITPEYAPLMEMEGSLIDNKFVGTVYEHSHDYDYISASHVIEHVPDPIGFVCRLQEMARKKVFILTPWKEREDILTETHLHVFDEKFLDALGNPPFKLLRSVGWGAFLRPRYKMLFIVLPGLASN